MTSGAPNSAISFLLGLSRKPWVCILSAALGLFIGITWPHLAGKFAPFGEIYIKLLTMTVTPIIFCALVTGVSRMRSSNNAGKYLWRTILTLVCGTLTAGFLGTFMALAATPLLKPDNEQCEFIGQTLGGIAKKSQALDHVEPGALGFIKNFIPENAVDTLASENLLSVVFMAILLGLALAQVKGRANTTATDFFSAVYEMFISVLDWILYLLPVGLFCLLADQASEVGADALKAMLPIILVYLVCFGIMAVLYLAQIRRATGKSVPEIWRILKEPFTLAFVASADSALPSIMGKMEAFQIPPELIRSVVPLSAVLNRHGTAIVFAITTVFVAHIYGLQLTMANCLLIALSCSLVGAFDSGEYVTIAPMITYILVPLGLPPEGGVAIILTIWPLFEWFPELQCAMASCANTAFAGNLPPGACVDEP